MLINTDCNQSFVFHKVLCYFVLLQTMFNILKTIYLLLQYTCLVGVCTSKCNINSSCLILVLTFRWSGEQTDDPTRLSYTGTHFVLQTAS